MARRISGSAGTPDTNPPRASRRDDKSAGRVLPINRRKIARKETLESILSSVLRSEDNELDQILRALSDLSKVVITHSFDSATIDEALKKAAVWAVEK